MEDFKRGTIFNYYEITKAISLSFLANSFSKEIVFDQSFMYHNLKIIAIQQNNWFIINFDKVFTGHILLMTYTS